MGKRWYIDDGMDLCTETNWPKWTLEEAWSRSPQMMASFTVQGRSVTLTFIGEPTEEFPYEVIDCKLEGCGRGRRYYGRDKIQAYAKQEGWLPIPFDERGWMPTTTVEFQIEQDRRPRRW